MNKAWKWPHIAAGIFVVLCDQLSKFAVQIFAKSLPVALNSFLSIYYSENTGAAWSIFQGHSNILAIFGTITMAAMIFFRRIFETPLQKFSLAIAFGGIVGNTIDRFFRGYVVDFIGVDLKFYRWPTFNVADGALCMGAVILLFTFQKKAQKAN